MQSVVSPKIENLEAFFERFRQNIVGQDLVLESPYGKKPVLYADWTASGRMYRPIEQRMLEHFGPYVANTHTETSTTGKVMTLAYHNAKDIIKKHVNASNRDVLIATGTGMTGAVAKFQRILGLKLPDMWMKKVNIPEEDRPVVFISHMEHHSNQTSWLETLAEVVIIPHQPDGLVCLNQFAELLPKYAHKKLKIASVTSCSNVTGIRTPYHQIAKMMHGVGGYCFVDFACSAPYVNINMHPEEEGAHLDAIFFSPHKFLGGPGTNGILIFNGELYKNTVPDTPGGGTVAWTNPWGGHKYFDDIEVREDGGTPGFLQLIRTALAIRLKEEMGVENILEREHELLGILLPGLKAIPNVNILAGHIEDRLGVVSFYINDLHFNLGVRLLNDHFGIQVRGGCSCAGTYGHYLLNIDSQTSHSITSKIDQGFLSDKPGWMRLSVHPTVTNKEAAFLVDAIKQVAENWRQWASDYTYSASTNEWHHKSAGDYEQQLVESCLHL